MTTLKGIKGDQIRYLDADPPNPIEGQMWFNSTTQTLKGAVAGGAPAGVWSSGGNLVTGTGGAGGFGIQTAAISFGGETPPISTVTQSYNGTSWSPVNSMNTAAYRTSGAGTQSAGKRVGGATNSGFTSNNTVEDWNGTSWTSGTSLNTGRSYYNAAAGTQTATITFGGYVASSPFPTAGIANVETWNGTSWTEVNDLNTARQVSGTGIQTAAIAASGANYVPPTVFTFLGNVELWNGSSWTETTEVNNNRVSNGASGISTDALIYGGGDSTGNSATTEYWNGSSWTEVNDLATARQEITGPSTCPSSTVVASGGSSQSTATEEWNAPDLVIKTVTTS